MTKLLTVIALSASAARGQTISSSWGWKTSRVIYGDVGLSYPVLRLPSAMYMATTAYSRSFNGGNGVLWGVKRSTRLTERSRLFEQGETGLSRRHGNHFAAQATLGVAYAMTKTVSVSAGVKGNKTTTADPFATFFVGISKRGAR